MYNLKLGCTSEFFRIEFQYSNKWFCQAFDLTETPKRCYLHSFTSHEIIANETFFWPNIPSLKSALGYHDFTAFLKPWVKLFNFLSPTNDTARPLHNCSAKSGLRPSERRHCTKQKRKEWLFDLRHCFDCETQSWKGLGFKGTDQVTRCCGSRWNWSRDKRLDPRGCDEYTAAALSLLFCLLASRRFSRLLWELWCFAFTLKVINPGSVNISMSFGHQIRF